MEKKKLTPGPWTPHHHMKTCVTFIGPAGEENLFIQNSDGYYSCQSEADANLIASAPELLEALTELVEHVMPGFTTDEMSIIQRSQKAMLKAHGK